MEGLQKDNQEMKKLMKEMIEKIDKVKVNLFVEEEYEFNVRFVDESKGIQMIVDSGAPVSIATSKCRGRKGPESWPYSYVQVL